MALESLITPITLDVYDHDTTPTTIKTISADDNSRYVRASLTYQGEIYSISSTSKVTLTIIRPDKTAVSIDGETFSYGDDETTSYGVEGELDIVATVIKGTLLGQFKIEDGTQTLRTEIFRIKNGEALDITATDWAGKYQGYNLDEFAEKIDYIGELVRQAVTGEMSIEEATLQTHLYIDHRISVHDNAIYINT